MQGAGRPGDCKGLWPLYSSPGTLLQAVWGRGGGAAPHPPLLDWALLEPDALPSGCRARGARWISGLARVAAGASTRAGWRARGGEERQRGIPPPRLAPRGRGVSFSLLGCWRPALPTDQPDNPSEENCGVIRTESSGGWQNRDCSIALPYVCKKKPNATAERPPPGERSSGPGAGRGGPGGAAAPGDSDPLRDEVERSINSSRERLWRIVLNAGSSHCPWGSHTLLEGDRHLDAQLE